MKGFKTILVRDLLMKFQQHLYNMPRSHLLPFLHLLLLHVSTHRAED